jgi:hypothetical protein
MSPDSCQLGAQDRSDRCAHVADLVVDSGRHDVPAVTEILLAALRTLCIDH